MRAMLCDRCQKLIEFPKIKNMFRWQSHYARMTFYKETTHAAEYEVHLCADCMEKMQSWLDEGKEL